MKTYKLLLKLLVASVFMGLVMASCEDDNKGLTPELLISFEKSELFLEKGSSLRLVATVVPSDAENTAHVWSSESPQIASVDETGLVTAHDIGKTKIVARLLANNTTAVCEVTVVDKIVRVKSIQLNTTGSAMALDDNLQLTATISPANATDQSVKWTSDNPEIATVDDNGLVKAVGIGETVIRATADSKSAQCHITVSNRTVIFSNILCSADDSSIHFKGEFESVGVDIKELGICWSKDKSPTAEDSHQTIKNKSPFVTDIKNLESKTSYYVRVYAKSADEIYYSSTSQLTTLQTIVTNFKLEEAYKDDCDGNKKYSLKISTPILEDYHGIRVCYGLAPNPEITDNLAQFTVQDDKCVYELDNLQAAKNYYIRAFDMKDNKPVYYPNEGVFSTIGKEVKLEAKYTGEYRGNKIWPYTINYTLPNKDDIYDVVIKSQFRAKIGKSTTDINSSYLNVKGGTGSLYVEMNHWQYFETWNGTATICFTNLRTGSKYIIRFGIPC